MKGVQMNKEQALEELSFLLYDVTNPEQWDQTNKKNWSDMQEGVLKLITYVNNCK